jgi:hypothetical protein
MGLRFGPLRADLMSAYSLGKFNTLSELQSHDARSNSYRLPTTPRMDAHRQLQSAGPKTSGSSKGSWKRQKRSEGGRPHHLDKSNRPSVGASSGSFGGAVGSEGHEHGNSSLEQKRELASSWAKEKGLLD